MAQGKAFTKEQREEIIQSLKPFLQDGLSRARACSIIGLAESTLSNWVKEDEALGMKLRSYENELNSIALRAIANGIKKELESEDTRLENSWKWAERKMKDDFSLRTENTGADGKDLVPTAINIIKPE